jgi:hypothetical protein
MFKAALLLSAGFAAGYAVRDAKEDPEIQKALNQMQEAFGELKDAFQAGVAQEEAKLKDKADDVADAVTDEPDTPLKP